MSVVNLRAFDLLNKVMHYDFEYMTIKDKGGVVFQSDIHEFKWGEWPPIYEYEVGRLEIMRWIMVKDKNGKEIYDLDIVRVLANNVDYLGIVVLNEGGCPMALEAEKYKEKNYLCKYFDNQELTFEVIGNVYENTDLCKKYWEFKEGEKTI